MKRRALDLDPAGMDVAPERALQMVGINMDGVPPDYEHYKLVEQIAAQAKLKFPTYHSRIEGYLIYEVLTKPKSESWGPVTDFIRKKFNEAGNAS